MLRSRDGKPWCDAFVLRMGDDLAGDSEPAISDDVRSVLGVPTEAQTMARIAELRSAGQSFAAIAATLEVEGHRPDGQLRGRR